MSVERAVREHFEFGEGFYCEVSLVRCFARWKQFAPSDEKELHRALCAHGCTVKDFQCEIKYPNGSETVLLRHYVGTRIRYRTLMLAVFDARRVHFPYSIKSR